MDEQETIEDVFFRDLEIMDPNKTPEEIEEIFSQKMKSKYYRDLAKIMLVTRLINNKTNKIKETYNITDENVEEDEHYEDDYETYDEESYNEENEGDLNENKGNFNIKENEGKNVFKENDEKVKIEEIRVNGYSIRNKSWGKFFFDFFIYFLDVLFSYASLIMLLLFITHLDKNIITAYGYYIINILILMKVIFLSLN